MYQILPLIILIFFSILLSFAIDRDVEDTIPVFVFSFLTCLFVLAVLKKPHHAFELSLVGFVCVWGFYIFRKRRIFPSIAQIKDKFMPIPVGLIVYFATLLVMWFAYSNHVVNNWDDFHFNATFARDMYTYGGMPVGWKAATSYKNYKPFMQMFYNWGFQATGGYSEPLMFRYKNFLVYTACLPLFKRIDVVKGICKKVCIAVFTIILPYLFMYEMVDSLSMDGLMGLLAGYSLCAIVFDEKRDWFSYLQIAVGLVALTLVKASAIMFTAICFAVWFFVEICNYKNIDKQEKIKRTIGFVGTGIINLSLWGMWSRFCKVNGNVTFLNDILDEHLDNNTGLPWFGKSTIINGFKGLFTTSMNLGRFSLTLMAVVLIFCILAVIMIRKGMLERSDHWVYFTLIGAIAPYYIVLMYTYIYVFFEYEAIALASYDRYLGTYATMLMFYILYQLTEHEDILNMVYVGVAGLCFVSLNFPYLYNCLVPTAYTEYKKEIIEERRDAEDEIARLMPEDYKRDAQQMLIVSNEDQTVYGRGLDFAVLPYVAYEVNISSLDSNIADVLAERLKNETIDYVYFCDRLERADITVCDDLIDGGNASSGTLYMYNEDSGTLEYCRDCH